jgi:hypothetical protein
MLWALLRSFQLPVCSAAFHAWLSACSPSHSRLRGMQRPAGAQWQPAVLLTEARQLSSSCHA